MCRWVAYRGRPVFLEDIVTKPCHSLIHQALHAEEAKTETNGDGFGVGWYGDRHEPGLYRETLPAWSDENLRHISHHVRASLFFAHVRASTGTGTSRSNCHPFAFGPWMFMHNGQIGGWAQLRRRVEAMIPDHHYTARQGTTDSEALFLVAQAALPAASPVDAMADALARVHALMLADGIKAPLRFSAAMTDGTDLYAFRWSSDSAAPTVYFSEADGDITVVSEPIDRVRERWHEVPPGHALVARRDKQAEIVAFDPLARAMAA